MVVVGAAVVMVGGGVGGIRVVVVVVEVGGGFVGTGGVVALVELDVVLKVAV